LSAFTAEFTSTAAALYCSIIALLVNKNIPVAISLPLGRVLGKEIHSLQSLAVAAKFAYPVGDLRIGSKEPAREYPVRVRFVT
jgi:hypothetical protein